MGEYTTSSLTTDQGTAPESGAEAERHRTHRVKSGVNLLPLSFLAALALSATSATSVYAYAKLICKDGHHCSDAEQRLYVGSVAFTSVLANVLGLSSLGLLENIARKNHITGLGVWLLFRAGGVAVLAFGVYNDQITVALAGRLLEGVASDNLLHFSLNAAFAQSEDRIKVSRLISASLGLYMVGISISPVVAGTLTDFRMSFVFALALFGLFFIYLNALALRHAMEKPEQGCMRAAVADQSAIQQSSITGRSQARLRAICATLAAPLLPLRVRPSAILPAVALLVYNIGQSYVFETILVYTTVNFGFTGKENGEIISIVHFTAAMYLFAVIVVFPWLATKFPGVRERGIYRGETGRSPDSILALVSLIGNVVFLVSLSKSNVASSLYALMPFFAIGLAASSFIKSSFIRIFPTSSGPQAASTLAAMETLGALLSPAILGGIQTLFSGELTLLVAAGSMALAALLLGARLLQFSSNIPLP